MRLVQAACVVTLLAVFLAYLLAPAVTWLQRRLLFGRRRRPLSRALVILLLYAALAGPGVLAWQRFAPNIDHWVYVTAPAVGARVFSADTRATAVRNIAERLQLREPFRERVEAVTLRVSGYVEEEIRRALRDLVTATKYVRWLAAAPLIAFLLLAYAPGFRRSALRVLPHGHLQWRGEEIGRASCRERV